MFSEKAEALLNTERSVACVRLLWDVFELVEKPYRMFSRAEAIRNHSSAADMFLAQSPHKHKVHTDTHSYCYWYEHVLMFICKLCHLKMH